ncbi:hypothetical protein EPUS_02273 [Endocarpon pusillum Z07020]|uniref:Uncharacterized protein n=1 Tax=Endocarpon pusillum (strain Z07020 / HMAS-L-300199) TaxID=1263415 RepID=U1I3U7_ENDPU|nr:uncharacterized protein EPUS_02273 [Endocarpon pusillum Z07020]ERF76734.1 hypothetical protein EPUS_02273 [Endocarpon pusillum Z07020]
MPRRYAPNGYDDHRSGDRRGRRLPRDGPGPGDIHDQQSTRGSTEQLSSRDPQERRYLRESRNYPDPGNAEDRAEIRVARRPRELRGPREPRYGMELPSIRDDTRTENSRPHERFNLQGARDPIQIAASANIQNASEGGRDRAQARYHQDTRQPGSEMDDAGFLSQNREDWDGRNLENEQEYQRSERSSTWNDMAEQAPIHRGNSRDPRLSSAHTRMATYFLPSEGISPEIIQADLGKHLGRDATFRPGTNREGIPGYLIRAGRPLTQNMISELMVNSKRSPDESLRRRGVPGQTNQVYRPDLIAGREDLESTSRFPPSPHAPHSPDDVGNSRRRSSTAEYGGGRDLFDRPERVEYRSRRPSRGLQDQPHIRSSEVRGSSVSQSSSYDSPWGGSGATQRSSRSSYSTAPSSVQSILDDQEREVGHGLTQYAPRRGSIAHYTGASQASISADQSYIDPRTGARVTMPARRAARERPAPSPAMQPEDDPPGWDDTPNFRGFAGGS